MKGMWYPLAVQTEDDGVFNPVPTLRIAVAYSVMCVRMIFRAYRRGTA